MSPRILIAAFCVIAGVVGLSWSPRAVHDPRCERVRQYRGNGGGGPGLNFDRWFACSDSVVTGVMQAVTMARMRAPSLPFGKSARHLLLGSTALLVLLRPS